MSKQRKEDLKIVYIFEDGRKIAAEDFNAEKDLTEEQNNKINVAFEDVLNIVIA